MITKKIKTDWVWRDLHDAFYDERQYVAIRTNRGGGKTLSCAMWLCDEMFTTDAQSGLWVDTVQNNIDTYVEQYFENWVLKEVWDLCNYQYKRKRLSLIVCLKLNHFNFIQFASAEEPKNAEGFRYHRIVLNEAGLILKNSSLWDNTLEPMTHPRDGVKNKTRIIGTSKGKNKFHQLCFKNDEDWGSHHFTIYDCPFYSKTEIEKIKKGIPQEVWSQEYLAEFIDGAGSVFRNISNCIITDLHEEPQASCDYIMSVDLAKHQDFTVCYIADRNTNKVVFQDRFNQIDWGFQKSRIINLYQKFNCREAIIDSTGVGDAIFDDLSNAGLNLRSFKFTGTTKNPLIQNLSVAIDNRSITFHPFPELISELEIFGYEVSPMGAIRYNAPDGYHDDCVISLALINELINNGVNADALMYFA